MSLKHFAMLSAISHHNQQNINNNNNNNNNKETNNIPTTFATTNVPEFVSKIINNDKSATLLKQQSKQIFATELENTKPTIRSTTLESKPSSLLATPSENNDKTTTRATVTATTANSAHKHHQLKLKTIENNDDPTSGDSSNYSSESNEILDLNLQQTLGERQLSNTYTSTTYYGSGFGVFHQQNTRLNGVGAGGSAGGAALITGSSTSNGMGAGSYSNGINNNVNLLLGGAMLTLITTILCVVCYCCHRNIKKRTEAAYRQQRQWLENDPNMEIYSVEQCYETSGLFVGDSMDGLATIPALHHEPPPSYDSVIAMQEQQQLLLQQQQQHQHQLLMQQQMLQQQLSANSSPPPGYRSSLDVNSIIPHARATALGGSIISDLEINSLASSTTNIRTSPSIPPRDPLVNGSDINGNVASIVPITTSTTTNNNCATPCYLRNKQQQPQQRNLATNQISQLNMKKVLQAQSCCSLQRAEVENMWNAAAAALAARSAHLPNDASASTSSPTLTLNNGKQTQDYKAANASTPETFGNRYLKQNYYRRGCPLCGKFRYDNDSTLSLSMDSNLDVLANIFTDMTEATADVTNTSPEKNLQTIQNNLNNNENLTNNVTDNKHFKEEKDENENASVVIDIDVDDDCEELQVNEIKDVQDEILENINDMETQCSCLNNKQKNAENLKNFAKHNLIDDNANNALATEQQSPNQTASLSNNNNITNIEDSRNLPSTSTAAVAAIYRSAATLDDNTASLTAATLDAVTINLDCINDNGIISLDMSKIIDRTGLPTYDAALKLESSGYV